MKQPINRTLASSLLLVASLLSFSAYAAEKGTALKADTLRTEPFADAKTAGNLTKNESLEILNKKGAWLQVKTQKNTGWVRLLSVKRMTTNGNNLGGAMAVATGRAGTGKVVSTTGIRGLSAEELGTAQYNDDEMKKLDSYMTSSEQGNVFAREAGLSTAKIAYLKGAK